MVETPLPVCHILIVIITWVIADYVKLSNKLKHFLTLPVDSIELVFNQISWAIHGCRLIPFYLFCSMGLDHM